MDWNEYFSGADETKKKFRRKASGKTRWKSVREALPRMKRWFRRKTAKNRRTALLIAAAAVAVIVAAAVLMVVLLSASRPDALQGSYSVDDYTGYEFDGHGSGAMCLGESTRYDFTYTIEEDTLTLDYEDTAVKNAVYTFRLEGDKLIITSQSTDAGTFTLTKKK